MEEPVSIFTLSMSETSWHARFQNLADFVTLLRGFIMLA